MPRKIEDTNIEGQLDLEEEIEKLATAPFTFQQKPATGQIEYDMSEEIMLQTGDRIKWLEDDEWEEGYFDGTVRWNVARQCWMLQIRTGETDATDLIFPQTLILLNQ